MVATAKSATAKPAATQSTSDPLENALVRWRNNLIDLTRRNPLLHLKPTRSSYLELAAPDVGVIFDHLFVHNKTWTFYLPPPANDSRPQNPPPALPPSATPEPPPPKRTELVTAEKDRARLLQILTTLYRRMQADFRERGLNILHLAAGILEWRDSDNEPMRSPLVLVPVQLKRKSLQEPFLLDWIDDDPFLNPALHARLKQDFDFVLPPAPEDWQEKSLMSYLQEVETLVQGLPGWKVERTGVLSLFSFFKGVIYQDLEDNAARLKENPFVQALGGLHPALARPTLPAEQELDDKQDPAGTYHILDADGSQRLCLEAAAQGESFVLIGPPGTGKSQTIANLIAEYLARGKRILFVSEKMAALEVVYKRLVHVGLGDFCLELHSHKSSKREVVKELARCLQERGTPADGATVNVEELKERRDRLNRYVAALHVVREPLRRSAWDALAELPRWNHLTAIPLGMPLTRDGDGAAGITVTDVTAAQLEDLKQQMLRLQNLWHIRSDPNYPWRGFKADRFTLQLRDEIIALIDKVRGRIDKLTTTAEQYGGKLGVRGPIAWLLHLGDVLEVRPAPIPAAWLNEPNLEQLGQDLDRCADQYQRLGQARTPLTSRYGAALWSQAEGTAAKVEQAWKSAAALLTPGDDKGATLLVLQQKLRGWAADTLKRLPAWITEVRTIEKWLAVPVPLGAGAEAGARSATPAEARVDPSPHGVRQLLRLAHLCMSENAPERSWVTDEKALQAAQDLVALNKPVFATYRERRQRLLQTYKEEFFELDLERIAQGYAGPYRSWLRMLYSSYRHDYRALRRRTHQFQVPDTIAEDVTLGRDLLREKARLEAERQARQQVIGRYEKGMDTDWDAAERALRVATEAIQLAHHLGCSGLPARLVDALCSTAPPQDKIRAAVKRLDDSFGVWIHLTDELRAILPVDSLPGVGEPLDECATTALCHYARELQAALNQLSSFTDPVTSKAAQPCADFATLVHDLHQAEELLKFEATQEAQAARWSARLGAGFQGINTNWDLLRKSLAWTRRLRDCFSSTSAAQPPTIPDSLLAFVTGSAALPSVRDLKQAHEQYVQALHGFEIRFDPPGPLLDGKRYLEHTPETVLQQLTRLRDRAGELSDWIDFRHLPDRFAHVGLGSMWKNLEENPPPREQVLDVFLKSFWSAWVEAVFLQDPVLAGFRRTEHERTLAEFRELDRQLIREGAARVARAALARWNPSLLVEQQQQMLREAHKKSRILPLRKQFEEMGELILTLKPCLLMSPLTVSQFLPADEAKAAFDLVVFDEASQILPEDAVGAIYRGKQVVITGDNRQLPPTTFFQQIARESADDVPEEEEMPLFESVLDAALGAGLPRHLLRWHYRSRHEHLIAFSNERYYEGRLVTFPAALAEHPALGVKFHHVPDGVYDRGGRRDNPREAQAVAELVLEHFRQHPDRTLGVIAFSYPQMNAIEDEIERRLAQAPELEKFVQEDRLEGFFVKNLETVQGDERDVIILSVGYGQDSAGKIALNFGPLNREGGVRRLNVAVTRARQKLVLVSSIRAADLGPSAGEAVEHLRAYLDFAERGIEALGKSPAARSRVQAATGLELEVTRELEKLGYRVVPQVGCGSFRLDLGVVDPKESGRFVLGIEFDGPNYCQAATARDRDRLRPEVLGLLGWKLHRIWSPDWLHRREEEVTRLKEALGQ